MNGKYRILLLLLSIIVIWKSFHYFEVFSTSSATRNANNNYIESADNTTPDQLTITVYYEALCPDSKFFIIYQLVPLLDAFRDRITIDLVPYGKAQTVVHPDTGKIEFVCQHDAVECHANKVHACVIELVREPRARLKYVACMIDDNMVPDDAGQKCAVAAGVDYAPIGDCVSVRGALLLRAHGERTHALRPPVKFIPTIELNGSQTVVAQAAILKDLRKAVCQVFEVKPDECSGGF